MALNMFRLDAKLGEIWGFSPLIFVRGTFRKSAYATLPLGQKPRHVEKFRECRLTPLTDVRESELTYKKRRNMRKT